jgi:glycosyltransferase involved in cell wall biosynthesis
VARDNPAVVVTGTVDDVRPYLAEAAVFVAPVRLGHGIKGKILEAFAMGVPVVCTARAANGVQAVPGRDLMVADRSSDFADAVLRLLDSPRERAGIGASGLGVARRLFDWKALALRLDGTYNELLRESDE